MVAGCNNAPPGWHLNEEGALVRDTIHSMLRRYNGWDYSQPAVYMIIIVLADRRSMALGEVLADVLGDTIAEHSARCELTTLGQAVAECWEAIPRFYPQVELICHQVMPDHFHGILRVKERLPCHLGQVIKGFKLGCNKAARRSAQCSAILSPSTVAAGRPPSTVGLFAEGFNDTILFRKGQLEKMVAYVKSNPLRLAIKRLHREFFKRVDDLAVCLPKRSAIASPGAMLQLRFSAIGNRFLLDRPLVQVQCSRRYFAYKRVATRGKPKIDRDAAGEPIAAMATPEYETLKEELLTAAHHGMVLISPCISDGERQIAREAFMAGVPLVTMHNKGFSKCQKPSGRYFDACAEGRLLMLAPAAWPYTTQEKPMRREDAVAMNRLCQWLAGDGAAEINYKGMTPANIDKLAKEAAMCSHIPSASMSANTPPIH